MSSKKLLLLIVLTVLTLAVAVARGQTQVSRPDFSGNWILVEGDLGADSPLRNEGSITQDGSAVTFRWSNQSLTVPFDGSKTRRVDNAFAWEYEGHWVGFAYAVCASLKFVHLITLPTPG